MLKHINYQPLLRSLTYVCMYVYVCECVFVIVIVIAIVIVMVQFKHLNI